MKVVIQTLVRNNRSWLTNYVTMIAALEHKFPSATFDVHVWENDSTDGSREFLEKHQSITVHGGPQSDKDAPRTIRLARYRNQLKQEVDISDADYVLMIDSGIWFGTLSFQNMLETLEKHKDIAMVIPHAVVKEGMPCSFFYDTFATITEKGRKCDQFTNLLPCENTKTNKHVRHCHYAHGDKPIVFGPQRHINLQSGFGGFVLIRPGAFNSAMWSVNDESECEHWAFCKMVLDHGRVVMDRNAKVIWSEWA